MDIIKKGFPDSLEELIPLLHLYFKLKNHFSVIYQDNLEIITHHHSDLRTRMVISRSLRNRVKKILHTDHRRDLVRVKQKAQQHVYWPNMMGELKAFIHQCK